MFNIGHIFTIILVQPILNFMVFAYNYIHDIGLVIILVTILIRLILLPSFNKSLKAQKNMAALQPRMNEIREQYKDNKEEQAKQLMAFYKETNTSPFSSCLPLLIQLPLLIALYQVFNIGLNGNDLGHYLYHYIHNPGIINPYFLQPIFHHVIYLGKITKGFAYPSLILGLIAGFAQFWQSRLMLPSQTSPNSDPTQKAIALQTLYVLPVLTVIISVRLPAGLPLYWVVTTLFAIGQQYYILKGNKG